jgi:hypothetical protein
LFLYKYFKLKCQTFFSLQGKECWKLNPEKNIWTIYSKALFDHQSINANIFQKKIYFADSLNPEVFDPVNNLWSQWPSFSTDYGNPQCLVTWHDTFVLLGGARPGDRKRTQRFNHTTQLWTEVDRSAPMDIFMSGCEVLPNQNILIVGSTSPDMHSAALYNVEENKWMSVGDTQYPRLGTSLVKLGSRVFAIYGTGIGRHTDTIEEFIYAQKAWIPIEAKLIIPRVVYHSTLAVPAYMFAHMDGGCEGIA